MSSQSLHSILTEIAENKRSMCVFDLDSTLFNVSPRTQKILSEFADLHKPEFKKIEINPKDWGLKESMIRAGYQPSDDPTLHQSLRDYWVDRFFSNEYLHYDTPYPGAVSFVQKLSKINTQLFYLTGRDQHRMGQGTLEVLLKWGFPVDTGSLHLKPHRSMEDAPFKLAWLKERLNQYAPIYFFENEPVNINLVGQHLPEIKIVYLDTTHSRKEEVNVPVIQIEHFEM